jgi:endonuclease/exonuclease/phosphatase family metal-dependent hydrolase
MKVERLRWVVGFLVGLLAGALVAQDRVEVMSYNIRMNTEGDGEHAWPHRRADVVNVLRFHRADIFGVQEALPDQMDDLAAAFPDFGYEGVGRDDGLREGEFSAVFYRKDRFEKLDGGTFWLSETPGQCSFGWDAACRRVCSWVKLKDREAKKVLYVFNTHLDHQGEEAREQSAALILEQIHAISRGKGHVVLCGDFNLPPDSAPIAHIREVLLDSYEVSEMPPHASVATFHGFTYDDKAYDRIDYVFVSEGLRVERYGALTDSRDRAFFSDHLPVLVSLVY